MRIDRRSFLRLTGAASVPLVFGRLPLLLAEEGRAGAADEILVVVQLSGGNDGLSMVVPFGDDAYARSRPTLRVDNPLHLSEYVGLHPNLKGLHALFQDGKLAVVQGVSYPNPNRSHFESMDIWHTGDLGGRRARNGWLGRMVDVACEREIDPNLVVSVGNSIPYALNADVHKAVSFNEPRNYRWRGRKEDQPEFNDVNGDAMGESTADWLHRVATSARSSSEEVRKAAASYQTPVDYPAEGTLGHDLRLVAGLIHGGLKTRVFYLTLGGFDTHVRQKAGHDNLMRQLGDSLAAFQKDLTDHGYAGRVLTLVFSEFGRRVQENASNGTDHGVAGPMFLLGARVKGGLHGKYPSLTDLDKGDLKMQVDFRSVYASVVEDWFKTRPEAVLTGAPAKLGVIA